MKIVYVEEKKQLADALTRMPCLNHVAEVKIQADWWSKMTQATKENEEITLAQQTGKAEKS